ncbi:DNA polymerase III subunit beta [Vibrio mediterranei]
MEIEVSTAELHKAITHCSIQETSMDDATAFVDYLYFSCSKGKAQCRRFGQSAERQSHYFDVSTNEDITFSVNYNSLRLVVSNTAKRYDRLTMTKKSKAIRIQAGTMVSDLNVSDVQAPDIEAFVVDAEIEVDRSDLERLVGTAKTASAVNDVRYFLNGMLLHMDEAGFLRAVATNGHRLCVAKCRYAADKFLDRKLILSNAGVSYVESLIKATQDSKMKLKFNSNYLRVDLNDGTAIKPKTVDGKYPDWERVVPMDSTLNVTVIKDDLISSMKSAIPFSNPKFKAGKLTFTPSGVKVEAEYDNVGKYEDSVAVAGFEGEEITIGFNFDYMIGALATVRTEQVVIGIKDTTTAVTLLEDHNPEGIYVVMPIRV